jgi:plastocyanin
MPQTHTVNIKNMRYQPDPVEISAGDSVEWKNLDAMQHTATADDGSFDSGGLTQNATFVQPFTDAGSVPYHCEFHGAMSGTVNVN